MIILVMKLSCYKAGLADFIKLTHLLLNKLSILARTLLELANQSQNNQRRDAR